MAETTREELGVVIRSHLEMLRSDRTTAIALEDVVAVARCNAKIQVLEDVSAEASGADADPLMVMAYGAPPIDERVDERYKIAGWLRGFDALARAARRTVSVVTVEEVLTAIAAAIEAGEYKKMGLKYEDTK
ncbi:hypothetical protein LCGC14_0258140 [marine sediment metagenome]|uniref:Uncharacterized protein n=1 Tax=marine sediment metagenome TaxID=412755 RepID=A0A0F9U2A6_9ZZZZ